MGNYTELYVHCVWATWDRLPLITAALESQLYASIITKCRELECEPVALGGIEDHVHLLARLSATHTVATLIKETKGASSHLMTHKLQPGLFFQWQGSYGALTVSKDALPAITQYIRKQKEHHATKMLIPDWARLGTM